jgi:hypothetical protein
MRPLLCLSLAILLAVPAPRAAAQAPSPAASPSPLRTVWEAKKSGWELATAEQRKEIFAFNESYKNVSEGRAQRLLLHERSHPTGQGRRLRGILERHAGQAGGEAHRERPRPRSDPRGRGRRPADRGRARGGHASRLLPPRPQGATAFTPEGQRWRCSTPWSTAASSVTSTRTSRWRSIGPRGYHGRQDGGRLDRRRPETTPSSSSPTTRRTPTPLCVQPDLPERCSKPRNWTRWWRASPPTSSLVATVMKEMTARYGIKRGGLRVR